MREQKLTRIATTAILVTVGALVAGCGSSKITASTRCKDYLEQPAEARHDAAVRISSESRVSDPGNPMWGLSLDAACGSQPAMRIEQYFGSSSARLAKAEATHNGSSDSSGATDEAGSEVTLPQSTLSEPAFVNQIEELEGYSTIALEGSTVIFYLAPIFYDSPLPPHAKEIQKSLEASCTAILHSEPFSAVKFQYKSGRVLVECSTTTHGTTTSSGASSTRSSLSTAGSFSNLRALRYPHSVDIDALSDRTLLPGCRLDPAEDLGYEKRVILRCSDLGTESSGYISDNTDTLGRVRLECGNEKSTKAGGTLWHCTTTLYSVSIEAYALSKRDVELRYAALVRVADANP